MVYTQTCTNVQEYLDKKKEKLPLAKIRSLEDIMLNEISHRVMNNYCIKYRIFKKVKLREA